MPCATESSFCNVAPQTGDGKSPHVFDQREAEFNVLQRSLSNGLGFQTQSFLATKQPEP